MCYWLLAIQAARFVPVIRVSRSCSRQGGPRVSRAFGGPVYTCVERGRKRREAPWETQFSPWYVGKPARPSKYPLLLATFHFFALDSHLPYLVARLLRPYRTFQSSNEQKPGRFIVLETLEMCVEQLRDRTKINANCCSKLSFLGAG